MYNYLEINLNKEVKGDAEIIWRISKLRQRTKFLNGILWRSEIVNKENV